MPLPITAGTRPILFELEPGTYAWCACGRSQTQPWCDGSHAGTGLVPHEFTLTEKKRVSMCTCKRTMNAPICDGAHKMFD